MRLLDLFCGAGGAAMGYHRAGFEDITGIDNRPMPRYPFNFIQADALGYLAEHGQEYDVIHASPPCQHYSVTKYLHNNQYPDLIEPLRKMLKETGKTYVIENVIGAPLLDPITLCGISFGLMVRRHRLFETKFFILQPPDRCKNEKYYVIFGHEVRARRHGAKAGEKQKISVGRMAMGIDWMTRGELSQAIPPAYTEYVGKWILDPINRLAKEFEPLVINKANS